MDQHLSIEKTGIQGLYVVNPASYKSDEDLIVETYNSQELLKNSLNMTFVQENQSMSVKGVLRGLHVQKNFPQGKLVRVVRGKIYDVAVDTRTTSSTYGDWYGVELSADNAEKKNAFICVIIAFLFHTSSLLILLIYLLYDYIVKGTTLSITGNNVSKRNETPRMLISMGIGFVVMIMMSAIVSALSAVGFGEYVSYVTGKLVFMPNQLLIRIPQIILIIWSYRYLRKDGEDISFFLVMEVYAVLFSQFTSVSGYGGRIALYFAIFEVLVISQAMSALKPRKSGIIIRPLIIGYYMFYWWYYFVFVGAHQTVPYIFMR